MFVSGGEKSANSLKLWSWSEVYKSRRFACLSNIIWARAILNELRNSRCSTRDPVYHISWTEPLLIDIHTNLSLNAYSKIEGIQVTGLHGPCVAEPKQKVVLKRLVLRTPSLLSHLILRLEFSQATPAACSVSHTSFSPRPGTVWGNLLSYSFSFFL